MHSVPNLRNLKLLTLQFNLLILRFFSTYVHVLNLIIDFHILTDCILLLKILIHY